MNTALMIVAAGKGSRMGGGLPKALHHIAPGEPCITRTISLAAARFKYIFIVTNTMMQDTWELYEKDLRAMFGSAIGDNVRFISIHSGLGDGHAVKNALDLVMGGYYLDDVTIMWGDVFVKDDGLFRELLSRPLQFGIIPACLEQDPYVTLLVDDQMQCMSADFSKYGEKHVNGFHDQSIFRFEPVVLLDALNSLHCALWKNGRYITPGGELSLLHTFHYAYNHRSPFSVYETAHTTWSFNTPEEIERIRHAVIT